MHNSLIYAYSLLRSSYMFQRYYLAIFRDLAPKNLKTYSNKMHHNKHTYIVVSVVQNFTDFG
jgi:hypothetical protein